MLPPALGAILRTLGYDVVTLREECPPDAKDVDWIPTVGKNGWIIVTVDHRIAKSHATREALKTANTVAVFLYESFQRQKRDDQVAWLVKHWRTIEDRCARVSNGTNLLVRQNGKIEIFD